MQDNRKNETRQKNEGGAPGENVLRQAKTLQQESGLRQAKMLQQGNLLQQAKDSLLGELIGLAKAVCGSIDEERFAPDGDTHQVIIKGLAAVAQPDAKQCGNSGGKSAQLEEPGSQKVKSAKTSEKAAQGTAEDHQRNREVRRLGQLAKAAIAEKWQRVPACEHCAHPCGRLAPYDLAELKEDEPAIRSLKGEILANVKKAALSARSAWENGVMEEAVSLEFYRALYAVGIFFNKEKLKPALQKSEALLKDCRALEAAGHQKREDERFMKEALRQAKKAEALGEVPIGCVIVRDGQIISRGYNRRTTDRNVLAHAEIMAINKACKAVGDWRLSDCTLYVTLEPCPMCAGAMVQSRLGTCVIGSMSDKSGCAGTVINLLQEKGFNHQVKVKSGVLGEECAKVLSGFFEGMRRK